MIRTPRTLEQAIALAERYAALQAQLAVAEETRAKAIADSNAVADAIVSPIVEELAALAAPLETWWARAAAKLTGGKRKSIELGGCMIGTRSSKPKFGFTGTDAAALAALKPHRWARALIRVVASVDKPATVKALAGKHGQQLAALGFSAEASETFFIERVAQEGTVGA